MDLPDANYRCYRLPFICMAGECGEDAKRSRRRCERDDTNTGCRYWCRNEAWGNCVLRCHSDACSQSEVAAILNVSQQNVGATEERALRKLAWKIAVLRAERVVDI
jgi:hypothetical protein